MNAEKQRIAIAEACGWKREQWAGGTRLINPEGFVINNCYAEPYRLPDYLNDLNAMHDAEKIAGPEFYSAQLLAVIHQVDQDYFSKVSWENAYELTTATAAQRAEALLKTIGKWEDENDHKS